MAFRIPLLVLVGVLSGCVYPDLPALKGVHRLGCDYGVLPQSEPPRCMTEAEYEIARKKLANSRTEASTDGRAGAGWKESIP